MKFNLAVLVIAFSFDLATSEFYDECDFVREIYGLHHVPRKEIYKHLCVVLEYYSPHEDLVGIYGIKRKDWCGEKKSGGGCSVQCSSLADKLIANNVACASTILKLKGLAAWRKSEAKCKQRYQQVVDKCLAGFVPKPKQKSINKAQGLEIKQLSDNDSWYQKIVNKFHTKNDDSRKKREANDDPHTDEVFTTTETEETSTKDTIWVALEEEKKFSTERPKKHRKNRKNP